MADGGKVRHLFINEAGSGGGEPAKYYQLTLPATGWMGEKPPYKQELTALELSPMDVPICDLADYSLENVKELSKITKVQSNTERIIFLANEKTTKDISINILCVASQEVGKPPIKSTLEEYSWEELNTISKLGATDISIYDKYNIHIGDKKSINITGTLTTVDITGNYYGVVIGLNHNINNPNNTIQETPGITFNIGENESGEGITIEGTYQAHKDQIAKYIDWPKQSMRTEICPQFLSLLPKELQSQIKATTKYYNNTNYCIDKIFIPSISEVLQKASNAKDEDGKHTIQYKYFTDQVKRCKQSEWFTRTRCSQYYQANYTVNTSGNLSSTLSYYYRGFAPCFVI